MQGKSANCDTSATSSIDEQELSSRCLKTEESCTPDTFEPKCDGEKRDTKIRGQQVNSELDCCESCSEQTSAHEGGVTQAPSHLDHPCDLSFTGIVSAESHLLPCTKSERASLPPRFTGYSKKAPMEQSEEAELSSSNIQVAHEVDIKETKHHDCPSWSPETNSETEAVSFSQAFLELQTMDRKSVAGRCEPTVEKTIADRT